MVHLPVCPRADWVYRPGIPAGLRATLYTQTGNGLRSTYAVASDRCTARESNVILMNECSDLGLPALGCWIYSPSMPGENNGSMVQG